MKRSTRNRMWAVVHQRTRKLIVVDGRLPLFWLRKPARDFAWKHGFTSYGPKADVAIIRVWIDGV